VLVILRTLVSALAVIVVPVAVLGAVEPATQASAPEKRICTVTPTLGTRLGNVRRCRTPSEIEAAKQESRRVVDRIQANKPSLCAPGFPSC
jgi:hypothetical protein